MEGKMKIFQKNKKSEDKSAQQDNGQVCVEDSGNNLYAVGSEQADNGNFQPRQVEDDQDVNQAISESGNKTDGVADSSNVVGSNTKESSSSQSGDNSEEDIKNSVVIKGNNYFGWVFNIVRNGVSKLWVENKIKELEKKSDVERAALRATLETRISNCLLIKIANNEDEIKNIKEVLNDQIEKQNNFESAITEAVEKLSAHWGNFYSDIEDQLQKVEDKVEDLDSQVAKANKNIEDHGVTIDALESRQTEFMKYVEKQFGAYKDSLVEVSNENEELKAEVKRITEVLKQLIELLKERGIKPKRDRRDPKYDENGCCPRCGSYHSFDIYNEGKTEKDSYYICAVCGMKDTENFQMINTKYDLTDGERSMGLVVATNLEELYEIQHTADVRHILIIETGKTKTVTKETDKTKTVTNAINVKFNNLTVLSLRGKEFTLGSGLFKKIANINPKCALKIPKLYGMKYVEKIEDGCFIGIQGDEERQKFWDENGFKIERKEKYFC